MDGRKKILFVKYGSFSHVNGKIESVLRDCFPSQDFVVLDAVNDILKETPFAACGLWLKAFLFNFRRVLWKKNSPWDFVFASPRAWRMIGRWILRNVDPDKTAFIFQTQSMFDASHPAIPFFIYTDHTRRAHTRQPLGGAPASVSAEWDGLEGALYRKADTVFTLSRFCALSVMEDYGIASDSVMPVSTGINMELPVLGAVNVSRHPVILFVASEWGVKGGPELAHAFARVREELPSAELWLVGARPPCLLQGMKSMGVVDLESLDRIFRKVSLVCVPSRVERASMVALDAAAYGLPVIMTPHGAGSERVRDGETGFLVDPRDTDALAMAILSLLRDPAKAARMGSAGRKMIEEEFHWDAVGKKISARIRERIPG